MFFDVIWAIAIAIATWNGVDYYAAYTPTYSHIYDVHECNPCYPQHAGTGDLIGIDLDDDMYLECDLSGDFCELFDGTSASDSTNDDPQRFKKVAVIFLDQTGDRWTLHVDAYFGLWIMKLPLTIQHQIEADRNLPCTELCG